MDFDDLMDVVMSVQAANKVGWKFFQEEREEGLTLVAKHREKGLKVNIENKEELESFCISGRLKY